MEEITEVNGLTVVTNQFTYGNDLISQRQLINGNRVISFFGYDGHGSVRFLTDSNGVVTDQYDYDVFGNLINQVGNTPNNYLYAGEQFDHDLNLYYNRARYLNQSTGRFFTMDSFEGVQTSPKSLHRYLYVNDDPVNKFDPSGQVSIGEELQAANLRANLQIRSANALGEIAKGQRTPKAWNIYEGFQLTTSIFGYHFFVFAGSIQYSGLGFKYDVGIDLRTYISQVINNPIGEYIGFVVRIMTFSNVPPLGTLPYPNPIPVAKLTQGQFEVWQKNNQITVINDLAYQNFNIIRYQFPSINPGTTNCVRWTFTPVAEAQLLEKTPF